LVIDGIPDGGVFFARPTIILKIKFKRYNTRILSPATWAGLHIGPVYINHSLAFNILIYLARSCPKLLLGIIPSNSQNLYIIFHKENYGRIKRDPDRKKYSHGLCR